MRFDYYSASIPASVTHCKAKLFEEYGDDVELEKPINGYKNGFSVYGTGLRVYHGGQNPLPFFVASGSQTPQAVNFIRRTYPSHRVSRADVCQDFDQIGGFDRAVKLIETVARPAGVEVCFQGDPDPASEAGRTYYFGSPKSDVRLVVYEKGFEQRKKGVLDASPSWFRVELRVRPRKDRKSRCARLREAEMYGLARWSLKALEELTGVAPEFVPDTSLRMSSNDRAFHHMLKQYGRVIRSFHADHGPEEFGRLLHETLEDE